MKLSLPYCLFMAEAEDYFISREVKIERIISALKNESTNPVPFNRIKQICKQQELPYSELTIAEMEYIEDEVNNS